MRYNPEIHHRRSIRLKGYDYGQAGFYFITICAWQRQSIFGEIRDGEMHLTPFGEVARNEWLRTPQLRPNIELAEYCKGTQQRAPTNDGAIDPYTRRNDDTYCRGTQQRAPNDEETDRDIPPYTRRNDDTYCRGTLLRAPTNDDDTNRNMQQRARTGMEAFGKPTSNTIPTMVRGYKAAATKQINLLRNCPQCPVWQRNYYEHVIRSEADYLKIATYILDNPRRWAEDSLNNGEGRIENGE